MLPAFQTVCQGTTLLNGSAHSLDLVPKQRVVHDLGCGFHGLIQRDACCQKNGHGIGKLRRGVHLVDDSH